jgi:hypothetical protein
MPIDAQAEMISRAGKFTSEMHMILQKKDEIINRSEEKFMQNRNMSPTQAVMRGLTAAQKNNAKTDETDTV